MARSERRRAGFPSAKKLRVGAIVMGLVLAAAMVLGFPLMLVGLSGVSWGVLADIGDAYGGASALLSAVALCGVGASLIHAQRQLRQDIKMTSRQQHFELIRMAIEDVGLLKVIDEEMAEAPDGRQQAYLNLMTNYWHAMWEVGDIDDDELRSLASSIFRGDTGRRWWEKKGSNWIGTRGRPSRRRFLEMLSEVCAAEAASAEARSATAVRNMNRRSAFAVMAAFAAVAATVGARSRRLRSTAG